MVKPGETGLLVGVGVAEELAEKIGWMVTHPQKREQMG